MNKIADSFTRQVNESVERIFGKKQERLSTGIKIVGNRYLITWSNNFEDRDGEIFTTKAQDNYVARVDAGLVPPPYLWVWHGGEKTRISHSEWVARHGHFVLVSGEFDDTPQAQTAKVYYQKHAKNTSVSHGFTFPVNKFDGKHYHEFNTFEISLLPRGVEANRYTALEKVKEMGITDDKLKYLTDVFGEDDAKNILSDLDKRGKALEDIGAKYKDFTGDVPAQKAQDAVETDLKAFIQDVVKDSADSTEFAAGAMTALKQHKADTVAALKAMHDELEAVKAVVLAQMAALKEQFDMRPRSAAASAETDLTAVNLEVMQETVKSQSVKLDSFWGTKVESAE